MKKEKGITLVALIITIVVMLIIVAVSVNLIVNSNLIGETEKAGATHENAVAKEQKLNPNVGEWKTVDDYLREAGVVEEQHNWQYTDETRGAIKCECDECKIYANNNEGRTINIGQIILYTVEREKEVAEGEVIASTKISAEKSGVADGMKRGGSTSIPEKYCGDYQVVQITEEPTWVVLGMEDKNNNGTNETLLITTKFPTDDEIILYGAAAYNNGVEEINRMCRELYGKEARGMTIEDVNNCLGYTNPKGMYYDEDNNLHEVNNLTTKLSNLPIWNDMKEYHYTPDGKNTEAALGEYLLNGGYDYSISSTEVAEASKDVINSSSNHYWLASRSVAVHQYAWFGLETVAFGRVDTCRGGFTSSGSGNFGFVDVSPDGYPYYCGVGFRPVVYLTSKIPETGVMTVYP